ncbi:MAG: hypothetical protein ACRDUY_15565 [Nitriliruptorales bacterium]
MRSYPVGAFVALVATMAGCGGSANDPEASDSPGTYSSELLQPMTALSPCDDVAPSPTSDPQPDGLVLPQGAVVVRVEQSGSGERVIGFVPLTPVQLLAAYEDLDVRLLEREHEQFESELVYEADGVRGFVKAQVVCSTGSNFLAVVVPAEAASELPEPGGG